MIYLHILFTDFNYTLQNTTNKRKPVTKGLLIFLHQNAKKKKKKKKKGDKDSKKKTKKKQRKKKKKKKKKRGKLIQKKIQKKCTGNNDKIIHAWYLQEAPGKHTYLPKKTGIFPVKTVRN